MLRSNLLIKKICRKVVTKRTILTSDFPDYQLSKKCFTGHIFDLWNRNLDNIAFIDDVRHIQYSYNDAKRCVHSLASGLVKHQVQQGSMVAIIAHNSPEYFMLIMALTSMKCTVSLCNQNFTPYEIKCQLTDSKPDVIFTDSLSLDKVTTILADVPTIKDIYIIGNKFKEDTNRYKFVDDLISDNGSESPVLQLPIDSLDQVALMPYSSGTTGSPKGVMLTHSNIVNNMKQLELGFKMDKPAVMLCVLPLYHIYATVIIPAFAFSSGSKLVFQPKFVPDNYLKAIEKYKVSFLHLVPPQVLFLLNYPSVDQYDLSSIETCLSSAAPLDFHVERRFIDKFRKYHPTFNIYQGYGLTELSPVCHIMPNKPKEPSQIGSVGKLLSNISCKVVDTETREELGPNQRGELLIKGPNVMKGYFGKTGATKTAFENDWFLTGDILYYDENGYFFVVDRIKDLIKVKGLQVAPAELEGLLLSHPAISDCAVIGIKHETYGEVPKAYIVKSSEVTETEIHEFMSENLSKHKQLTGGIVFVDEIPKSPSGKLLRRILKE